MTATTTLPSWALKPATCPCDGEFVGCERCEYLDRRESLADEIRDAITDDADAEFIAELTGRWADEFGGDEFRPTLDMVLAVAVEVA